MRFGLRSQATASARVRIRVTSFPLLGVCAACTLCPVTPSFEQPYASGRTAHVPGLSLLRSGGCRSNWEVNTKPQGIVPVIVVLLVSAIGTATDVSLHDLVSDRAWGQAMAVIATVRDLDELDRDGRTALTIAMRDFSTESFDVAEALLRLGADASLADRHGLRPIHYAARTGHLAKVMLLVDAYGADVNATPAQGSEAYRREPDTTPLGLAYLHGHKSVVEFLRRHSARAPEYKESLYKFQAKVSENMRATEAARAVEIASSEDDDEWPPPMDFGESFREAVLKAIGESPAQAEMGAFLDDLFAMQERVRRESAETGADYVKLYNAELLRLVNQQPPDRLKAINAALGVE